MQREALRSESRALVQQARTAAKTSVSAFALLWPVHLVTWLTSGATLALGLQPGSVAGLLGIATMPLIHGGWGHLLANTLVGIPLAFLAMERKRMDFFVVAAVSAITSGLGCWVFGAAGSVHVGASGVVFGLLGFLIGRGIFERRLMTMLMAGTLGFFFSGALLTMLPGLFSGISWQAHLFGFLGGLLVSRVLGKGLKDTRLHRRR